MIQPWNRKCDRSKERRTSLDVNRRDMGREGEVILLLIPFLRSSQPSSRFFLPFPRGWSVAAEFDKLERLKWIRARHRPRFYRNTEREREREIAWRTNETARFSLKDRRRGTIESRKTRVRARSFCIPLLTRLLNLLRNREATYIRRGSEAEYMRGHFGGKYREKEKRENIDQKLKI